MTTLNTLNNARIAAGLKPLKAWKGSKQAMADALAKLRSAEPTEFSKWCAYRGINPKVARAKLRHRGLPKTNGHWVLTAAVKAALAK